MADKVKRTPAKLSKLVEDFDMEIVCRGSDYDQRTVSISDMNRPALQLVGFYDYFEPKRLQVFGKSEMTFLKAMKLEDRRRVFDNLLRCEIPALIIARNMEIFPELLEIARKHGRTLLRSELNTVELTSQIIDYLNRALAPQITRHGVLMNINGQGVLLLGESGIGKSETAIRKLLLQAATEAMEREDAIYYHYDMEPTPFEENAALNNLLDAGARQTCGTWQNLTATTANTVTGAFERTLDAAWLKVGTGAFDYKTAVKQAVDSLADDMPMVTYPSGHTDSIEVAARRAILTGVNQTTGKLQVARMDEMGCEFVETTAHGGARPSHAEWQGRRFHRGGAVDYKGRHYPDFEAATGYGTGAGLCGWNCRHQFFACFPELGDPPQWTQEQLQELNARNIEYNGKKYTAYELSQMQRARERNVRRWKKRYLAEDAAGLDTTDSAVRLRAARQSLAEFAQATGGRVDSARVSVPKFGRSEASRASAQARKVEPHKVQSTRGSGGASGQNGKTVRKVLGKVDTTNTKQVDALKNSFCSGYAKSDVEHMMVITKDGEVHYMTDNNPRGVDCSYLGGKLEGSYNIHTHPPKTTQYSFSTDADIPGAFADGTAVMEAVDYKYRYRFVVPENITFEQWEAVCEEVREERNAVMESRGYGFDDYEENIQHVIIDETCRRLGLKCYHREKRT